MTLNVSRENAIQTHVNFVPVCQWMSHLWYQQALLPAQYPKNGKTPTTSSFSPQWELVTKFLLVDFTFLISIHCFVTVGLVCLCMLLTSICVRVFGRMKLNVISSYSVVEEPVPEISNCIVLTDELLAFTEGLVSISSNELKTVIHKIVTRWHC